ncbi:MAG: patatin-like phospholipase family protein [Paludibacter sp.]|nr:patatin-like phospholipase family protein [Bacteroidales bacterium]MCM1069161.1 patatin-like phospholipase family protein [Prevotella sp.]MCM1354066.1 patatin-like phospholipase family protein [Bacteroides sp.]MCM1442961.1 patatin-like phospholipase family protein [Muribaculum sp.]MCM1481716.1 patatin-like phospholipase family protein [Paludibacter sp.]
MKKTKKVALVLGSGGARGLAHIGAIEELESRGYEIGSIAGCSMGAMIAGMYAAGRLQEAKEWFLQVDKQKILKMVDLSISLNSLVKGERIINALKEVVPDQLIEDLRIPCTIVSADLISANEVVFEAGHLFEAIRASISIPLFFQPVQRDNQLLIDGGILNPLPLNRIQRKRGDLLVAMNISGKDQLQVKQPEKSYITKAAEAIEQTGIKLPTYLQNLKKRWEDMQEEERPDLQDSVNYFSLVDRMSDMQIQQNTNLMLQLLHPDILATMPQYAFTTFDFDRAEEIIEEGRRLMSEALDRYEGEE